MTPNVAPPQANSAAWLRQLAARWAEVDPDPAMAAAVRYHLADDAWLTEHFGSALRFGTAGLRAAMGPGPARMNRVVARLAARAIGRVLAAQGRSEARVVVGYDARPGSAEMARDSAQVLAAMGCAVTLIDGVVPTPVLARLAVETRAAAAVMVTASHNPRGDNGYKVYWSDGTQIRPPIDAQIEAEFGLAQLAAGGAPGTNAATVAEPGTGATTTAEPAAGAATDGKSGASAAIDLVDAQMLAPINHVDVLDARAAVARYVGAAIRPYQPRTADSAAEAGEGTAGVPADEPANVRVAYTAMYGVGAATISAAFATAGLAQPSWVASQCEPDGTFAAMAFPNPEEPGALAEATAHADAVGIDLVLANDPDADRLAVATREANGWRRLTGDEIGLLLCDHLIGLRAGAEPQRELLAASSVVSGSAVEALCASRGVAHHRTLTGFKWVMLPRLQHPRADWVFGYEEALGYSVSDAVLDKDGVAAAVEFTRLAEALAARGATPSDRLDELAGEIGAYVTGSASRALSGSANGGATLAELRAGKRNQLAGYQVTQLTDWNKAEEPLRTDLVEVRLDDPEVSADQPKGTSGSTAETSSDGGFLRRVSIRPSGTEPKVKVYAEVAWPQPVSDAWATRAHCTEQLEALLAAATELLGR